MSILTEAERVRAIPLVEKGLSYGEVAHMLLLKRNVGMQRPMAEEVAALFGRKLHPIRELTSAELKAKKNLMCVV